LTKNTNADVSANKRVFFDKITIHSPMFKLESKLFPRVAEFPFDVSHSMFYVIKIGIIKKR